MNMMPTISAAAWPIFLIASVFLSAEANGIGRKKTDEPMKNNRKSEKTFPEPNEFVIRLIIGGQMLIDESAPNAKARIIVRLWQIL